MGVNYIGISFMPEEVARAFSLVAHIAQDLPETHLELAALAKPPRQLQCLNLQSDRLDDFKRDYFYARLFERLYKKLGHRDAEKYTERAETVLEHYRKEITEHAAWNDNAPLTHLTDQYFRNVVRDTTEYLDLVFGKQETKEVLGIIRSGMAR